MGKIERQIRISEYIDEHLQEHRAIAMETHKRPNTSNHEYFMCHRLSKKLVNEGLDVHSLKFKAVACSPQRRASIGPGAKRMAVSALDRLLNERLLESIKQQHKAEVTQQVRKKTQ